MPSAKSKKQRYSPQVLLRLFVMLVTSLVILGALWTAGAAIAENIRFAQATNQILRLVAVSHDLASRDKDFATQPDEDVLAKIARSGLVGGIQAGPPATLTNPWEGSVIETTIAPSTVRIETLLPARDCRRMALFFSANGDDLGLSGMETMGETGKIWKRFYDRGVGMGQPTTEATEEACAVDQRIRLAIIFVIR